MTSDLPPLSETHPTLFDYVDRRDMGLPNRRTVTLNEVQLTTVDKAEHERVKQKEFLALSELVFQQHEVERLKQRELDLCKAINEDEETIERLKKEHEDKCFTIARTLDKMSNDYFAKGVADGERRAMQRVKEAILHQYQSQRELEPTDYDSDDVLCIGICQAIEQELGLSDKDDEQEPKKDADDGSYVNATGGKQ